MEDKKTSSMEETELHSKIDQLHESLKDVCNVVQLLEISLTENEDDKHIIRSVKIIDRMLSAVIEEVVSELKQTAEHFVRNDAYGKTDEKQSVPLRKHSAVNCKA